MGAVFGDAFKHYGSTDASMHGEPTGDKEKVNMQPAPGCSLWAPTGTKHRSKNVTGQMCCCNVCSASQE